MPIRLLWTALPAALTQWVEAELGAPIAGTTSQHNGFSSGSADRVVAENGRRAFVKTMPRSRNAHTVELHLQEGAVMRMLPADVRAPALLGVYDDGEWVALLIDDIDGRRPGESQGADITAVLDAIAELPAAEGELAALPRVSDEVADLATVWDRLRADGGLESLPAQAVAIQERMSRNAGAISDVLVGEHLVHFDCRADNILIDEAGEAWLLDWPWASIGARWFDGLTYLLDVEMRREPVDVDSFLRHPVFDELETGHLEVVLSAIAGGFYDKARQPAPPSMPTLRAFQRDEADAAVRWLARRWGD